VEDVNGLQRLLAGELIGRDVALAVVRDGEPLDVPVVPAELEL
jgi:S1-C subfamily serine protease